MRVSSSLQFLLGFMHHSTTVLVVLWFGLPTTSTSLGFKQQNRLVIFKKTSRFGLKMSPTIFLWKKTKNNVSGRKSSASSLYVCVSNSREDVPLFGGRVEVRVEWKDTNTILIQETETTPQLFQT